MLVFFLILGIVIFIGFYSLYMTNKGEKEMHELNDSRPKLTRAEYIEILTNSSYEQKHVEIAYDEIKKALGLDFFSIHPEDDIYEVYGLDDLDDIELFDNICKKLNLRKVQQKDCDLISGKFEKVNVEYILTLTKNIALEAKIH